MGVVDLHSIVPQQGRVDEAAVEIGSVPREQSATAMWLDARDTSDPTLVYKREVGPLSIGLVPRQEQSGRVRHRWSRLEVKIHRRVVDAHVATMLGGPGPLDCIVAIHPYYVGWIGVARLKPASRREQPKLPEGLDSTEQIFTYLQRLDHDYWETGNYWTAGFDTWSSLPDEKGNYSVAGFDTWSSLLEEPSNVPRASTLVIGMCCGSAQHRASLITAGRVRALLGRTKRGKVRFTMKGVPSVPLYDEVREAGHAHMDVAIQQALAGPHKDSGKWIDREVVHNVEHIYKLHLNNHNRRLSRGPDQVPFEEGRDG